MDKNWIVIPDVHGRKFWRDVVKGNEDKRIIFLGDYLDPYPSEGITSEDAYNELIDIIAFKKNHPDNVTLLLGNHDLGYLDFYICQHRQDFARRKEYQKLLIDNLSLFNIVLEDSFADQKILFSHAGIRTTWLKQNEWLFDCADFSPPIINELFHDEERRTELFIALSDSSACRGGYCDAGSVVWADVEEFIHNTDELPGYIQVFGHTLHEGGAIIIDKRLWCLDCEMGFILKPNADGTAIEIVK